ncbi:glycosyltransferase [Vibrio sp. SM6]|uniref:Glycosyltransferase n=2 Tax=Vibrio agarilyticus TaxID=2726741 RepID=A0A7X8YGR0_9VIBR|nr:glycosyltransferase [Vibrio agarilyticus]
MALDYMQHSHFNPAMKIISLEGSLSQALEHWPRLKAHQDKLIFLNKPSGWSAATFKALNGWLKVLKADVVHTHHIGPYLYGGLAAHLSGLAHMHTEHDAWHFQNVRHRLMHKFVSGFGQTKLIADAHIVAKNLAKQLGIAAPQVIKNGIDLEKFVPGDKCLARQQLGLDPSLSLIGSSGRLEVEKGHQVLIQALAKMDKRHHLAIAGSGSQSSALRRLAHDLKLSDRVHFLGHLDSMPRFYQALDLFCLPSFNEGYPLAPLEAQACNIAAAVTDVGGATETLCPQSGTRLLADNPKQMAIALDQAMRWPSTVSPRLHAQEKADVCTMARRYDRAIFDLLAKEQANVA